MRATGPSTQIPAVVVGVDCTVGLQTSRILAGHGVPVIGLAAEPRHFLCRTRSVRRIVAAGAEAEATVAALEKLGRELGGPAVLLPATNEAARAISAARAQLQSFYRMALPSPATFTLLADKVHVEACAQRAGLRIPATRILHSRADAERAARELPFPGIVKPSVKTPAWMLTLRAKALRVANGDELLALYDRGAGLAPAVVVQEWIPGPDRNMYSYYSYIGCEGAVLAELVARKLRQWPLETGVGCLAQQCEEPRVSDPGRRLLRELDYRGISSVQFKRHALTDAFYYIEANVGRSPLNLPLAEACGMAMTYTMYCDLAGLPLPAARTVRRPGAKWISLRLDMHAAWQLWRRGELTLGDWWRSLRGVRWEAEMRWRDPGPCLCCLGEFLRRQRRLRANKAVATVCGSVLLFVFALAESLELGEAGGLGAVVKAAAG